MIPNLYLLYHGTTSPWISWVIFQEQEKHEYIFMVVNQCSKMCICMPFKIPSRDKILVMWYNMQWGFLPYYMQKYQPQLVQSIRKRSTITKETIQQQKIFLGVSHIYKLTNAKNKNEHTFLKMSHCSLSCKWFCKSMVWVTNLFHNWLLNGGNGSKWVRVEIKVHRGKWHGKIWE